MRKSVLFFICFVLLPVLSANADLGSDAQREQGKLLYDKHCAQCHGEKGDGLGVSAPYFHPRPRDFTKGKYKIRHTENGELPTDEDIKNAIRKGLAFKRGMAYTGMPPWPNLHEEQITNLTYYLKSFSPEFSKGAPPKEVTIPELLPATEESIKKGREVFEKNECVKCHGVQGRGDGRSAPTLKDDWGNHIRPADLTKRWTFRGGGTQADIFRTISTGFNGTPMPSYADSASVEDRLHLVNYLYSLSDRDEAHYNKTDGPIVAAYLGEPIEISDLSKAKVLLDKAAPNYIPIVGQVVEPGREFYPGVNEVEVRAVYNDQDIAIMLRWHDIREDKTGSNGPDLEVVEEKPVIAEVKEEVVGGDPFADEEAKDPFAEGDPFAEEEKSGSKYTDAVLIQLPTSLSEGFVKPYFILGDSKNPVHLWFTDLAKKEAKEFQGKGHKAITVQEKSTIESSSEYKEGEWTVIFKRKRSVEGQIEFVDSKFIPIAFSVWDGFNDEHGAKRGLTTWYSLFLEPKEKKTAMVPMLLYGGGILFLEIVFVALMRRNSTRKRR